MSGIVGLIDVKQKGSKSVGYWANYVTFPFDHTHDLGLNFSRSKFEIALSQESEGWLTWNKRDVSRSFMTMMVTFLCPWWSGWMHQIVTGVTLDTSVPSTLLVEEMLVQFCTENTYVIAMLCANFKMIQWLCKSMWTNEFMQAFSSRWALTYRLYCYIALIFPLTVTLVVSIHALFWLSPLRVMEGLAAVCMAEVLGEGNQVQVAGMEKPIYIYIYVWHSARLR